MTDEAFTGDFGSLAHAAAKRRKEREQRRATPIILPVPGYRDLFATKFRRVSPSEAETLIEKNKGDTTGGAVAMILAGCDDILAVTGHDDGGQPIYQSLGRKWSPATVTELFEVDIPAGSSVRFAIEQALDEAEIRQHFEEYAKAILRQNADDSGDDPGESKLSAES